MKKAGLLAVIMIFLAGAYASAGPAYPESPAVQQQLDEDDYIIHVVRWFENIKDISKKYGVPVDVIAEINGLKKNKVKKNQKLRIPADYEKYLLRKMNALRGGPAPAEEAGTVSENLPELPEAKPAEEQAARPVVQPVYSHKSNVTATLLLHLDDSAPGNMDFYAGALLAARNAGENGTGVDLNIIDLSAGGLSAESESKILSSDIVIGPVQASEIASISQGISGKTIFISPLDPRGAALADTVSNVIQAPSSAVNQYSDLSEWIADDWREGDNVVLISEKGARPSEGMSLLSASLAEEGVKTRSFAYTILEGRDILESFSQAFLPETTNRVVILSESEAFTNDVVRNLNVLLHNKYNVVLYAPSRIRNFDTIEVENLHRLNLHVSMSYYINYDKPEVMKFLAAYRALFSTEPNQFAFQGYDVTTFFINVCAEKGSWWRKALPSLGRSAGLGSSFEFEKGTRSQGLLNTAVRRAVYEFDYSVTETLH